MKLTSIIAAAVIACAASISAVPGRSPICDVAAAKAALLSSPMGPTNKKNLAPEIKLTSSAAVYTPGQPMQLTMTGPDFQGILLYANPSSDPSKRVGKFEIPPNFQNNAAVCQNSEFPESSLTHTAGQTYAGTQQLSFTAPATDVGEISFNAVVVMKDPVEGFAWGILPNALKVASPSGQGASAAVVNGLSPIEPLVQENVECPRAFTATLVRKCKVRGEFKTTINRSFTQMVTMTETKTIKETQTITVQEACRGAVLGAAETPMPAHEMPNQGLVLGAAETPMIHVMPPPPVMQHERQGVVLGAAETPAMQHERQGVVLGAAERPAMVHEAPVQVVNVPPPSHQMMPCPAGQSC